MENSLEQVVELGLQGRDPLFDGFEPAMQWNIPSIALEELQDLGAGKIGNVTGATLVTSFFQRAVLVLAEPEYDDSISGFAGHDKSTG
jgi:hypothetical protein